MLLLLLMIIVIIIMVVSFEAILRRCGGLFRCWFCHPWDGSYIRVRYSVALRKFMTPLATSAVCLGGGFIRVARSTVR